MSATAAAAAAATSPPAEPLKPVDANLRCRLETSAWPRKQEIIGVIRQLSAEQAEAALKKRPVGSCLLRIDEHAVESGKTPLIVSYRYNNQYHHKTLKHILRARLKPPFISLKVEPKQFKFLQLTLFPFLDQVTVFINEFCNNKHYIERDLTDAEIERELTYRRFLIYPEYGHITLIKRADDVKHGIKSLSVSVDFNECKFTLMKSGEMVPTGTSFNEVLLEFLNIRAVDTFLVVSALGYNPTALRENVTRDRSFSFVGSRELPRLNSTSVLMSKKDITSTREIIDEHFGNASTTDPVKDIPDPVIEAITTMQSALQGLDARPPDKVKIVNSEKVQWFREGVFASLVNVVCRLVVSPNWDANLLFKETVAQTVEIISLLIKNFHPACEALYQTLFAHLQISPSQDAVIGICYLLAQVIATRPFAQVFIAESGAAKLLELYNQSSAGFPISRKRAALGKLPSTRNFRSLPKTKGPRPSGTALGSVQERPMDDTATESSERRTKNMLRTLSSKLLRRDKDKDKDKKSTSSPSPSRAADSKDKEKDHTPKETTEMTTTTSSSEDPEAEEDSKNSKSRFAIPLLRLPQQEIVEPAGYNRRQKRRSLQKSLDSSVSELKELNAALDNTSFARERTAAEELRDLAKKLGETFMAADLTALLPYKQYADARTQRKLKRSERLADEETDAKLKQNLDELRATLPYRVKCDILKVLNVIVDEPDFRKFTRNPINLLFSEITMSYREPVLRNDPNYQTLLFSLLQKEADLVEVAHTAKWEERVKGLNPEEARNLRKKLDVFAWRVHNRLLHSLESQNLDELETQLALLSDYIKNCPSRVQQSQIIDLCMKTLLLTKSLVFKRKIDTNNWKNAIIVHRLLCIFDDIASQNRFLPLNDLMLTIWVFKDDSFEFVKNYAGQVLANREFEKKILDEFPNGKSVLREWRTQVIRHHMTCIIMIRKQYKSEDTWDELISRNSLKNKLLQKVEFLIHPARAETSCRATPSHACPPQSGLAQTFIAEGSQYHNYALKVEMLRFLHKIFSIKHCPYTKKKAYVDSYISFHYIQMVKLYNNYALDKPTLDLCRRHLKIMIDFATQKDNDIRMKFYQLRAVDFLAHELNLEYEIKVKRKKFSAEMARQDAEKRKLQSPPVVSKPPEASKVPEAPASSASAKRFSSESAESTKSDTPPKPPLKDTFSKVSPHSMSTPEVRRNRSNTLTDVSGAVPKLNLNTLIAQKEGPARRLLLPALLQQTAATQPEATGPAEPNSQTARRKKHISLDLRTLTDRGHGTDDSSGPATPANQMSDNTPGRDSDDPPTERLRAMSIDYGVLKSQQRNITSKSAAAALAAALAPLQSTDSGNESEHAEDAFKSLPRPQPVPATPQDGIKSRQSSNTQLPVLTSEVAQESAQRNVQSSLSSVPSQSDSDPALLTPGAQSPNPDRPSASLRQTKLPSSGTSEASEGESSSSDPVPAPTTVPTPGPPKIRPIMGKLNIGSLSEMRGTPIAAPAPAMATPAPKKPAVPKLSLGGFGKSSVAPVVPSLAIAKPEEKSSSTASSSDSGGSKVPKLNFGSLGAKVAGAAAPAVTITSPKFDGELTQKEFKTVNWNELEEDPELEITNRRPGDRRYTLTSMELQMKTSVKLQVVLDRHKDSKDEKENPETPDNIKLEERLYMDARDNRKLYADEKLHIAMLELIFSLLLAPNGYTLDHLYTHQFPLANIKLNVPYILWLHLNHAQNKSVLGALAKRTQKVNESEFRLLKLLSTRFFQPSLYKDLQRMADGAYGTVYSGKLLGEDVAVKQMLLPRSIHDRCVLHDIFTEILVLDKWKADERICKLIDYGLDDESYWIAMKKYRMSLRTWRKLQTTEFWTNLPLYLNIYTDILNAARFLSENRVNHYDIKCDNFLIDPIDPAVKDSDLADWPEERPNFTVCLADFGESLVFTNEVEGYTIDNRGTEFIKSPEMLTIAYASRVERQTFDRRKKVGANKASDIWSLGALLYELLTGEFLFYDDDWVRFWLRVTSNNEELLSEKRKEKLRRNPHLMGFFNFVLVREPTMRPTYQDLIQRFAMIKRDLLAEWHKEREAKEEEKDEESPTPKEEASPTDDNEEATPPEREETSPQATSPTSARGRVEFSETETHSARDRRKAGFRRSKKRTTGERPERFNTAPKPSDGADEPDPVDIAQSVSPLRSKSTERMRSNTPPREDFRDRAITPDKKRRSVQLPLLQLQGITPRLTASAREDPKKRHSIQLSGASNLLTEGDTNGKDEEEDSNPATPASHLSDSPSPRTPPSPTSPHSPPSPTSPKVIKLSGKKGITKKTRTKLTAHKRAKSIAPSTLGSSKRKSTDLKRVDSEAAKGARNALAVKSLPLQASPRRSLTLNDLPTDNKTFAKFGPEETGYFRLNPSHITNSVLLGAYECLYDKKRLKTKYAVTHIVNCSAKPNLYPDHFQYEQLNTPESEVQIPITIQHIFSFARDAIKAKGKILVVDEDGTSLAAAVVMSVLMKLSVKKVTFFDAYKSVYSRRYIVQLPLRYIQQLTEWSFIRELRRDGKQRFRCICGANTYTLLQPVDQGLSCSCTWDSPPAPCPYFGCGNLLVQMKKQHNWSSDSIKWGFTTLENVTGEWDYSDEQAPVDDVPLEYRNLIRDEKDWRLFKCRGCSFITHAVSTTDGNILAIVTNIPFSDVRAETRKESTPHTKKLV